MKKSIWIFISCLLISCNGKPHKSADDSKAHQTEVSMTPQSQIKIHPERLSFKEFEHNLHFEDDTIYIINFWVLGCQSCSDELPYFDLITSKYRKKVKFILVSLDLPDTSDSSVVSFLKKKNVAGQVVFLDDPFSNSWIPKVDAGWNGALPATLIYNKDKRKLYQNYLCFTEMDEALKQFL